MNSENKNSNKDQTSDWKLKINDLVNTCQTELKKTTQIGMKMLSASQANSQLHETYETIGRWLVESIEDESIKVDDDNVEALVSKVKDLEKNLAGLEEEVQEIKKTE